MTHEQFDVAVLGGGPAGMAAALAADDKGRAGAADRAGGPPGRHFEAVHPRWVRPGAVRQKMAGPEYAQVFIDRVNASSVTVALQALPPPLSAGRSMALTLSEQRKGLPR